jgi:hypothetical protein
LKRTASKSSCAHEFVFEADSRNRRTKIFSQALLAADVMTYTPNANSVYALPTYSATNSIATASSNAVALALNGQVLLLTEMVQEHQKRAADIAQKNQPERAQWESDLVNELQQKRARVQKSIEQATPTSLATSDLKAAATNVDDQIVFVSTVEARLEEIRQQLSAAIEDSRALSMQIGTNRAAEDFGGLSLVLGENQKVVKELQREGLDLELRKLEFRALLKAIQK